MTFRLPTALAHRGANQLAPENTLSAFRLASSHHASWIELDLMLSRDHIPVIFHDDRLERVTDGQGFVADHSLVELKALNVKALDVTIPLDKIPTLVEFLEFLSTTDLGVNLEIKANQLGVLPTCQQVLTVLQHMGFDSAPWQERLMVSSFDREAIVFFKQQAPWLPRSYLIDAYDYQNDCLSFAKQYECVCVSFWHKMPTAQAFLTAAQAVAMPTLCYTVDDDREAKHWFQQGVDGIFTNNCACYNMRDSR